MDNDDRFSEKISLLNFNSEDKIIRINSPRSLEACKR